MTEPMTEKRKDACHCLTCEKPLPAPGVCPACMEAAPAGEIDSMAFAAAERARAREALWKRKVGEYGKTDPERLLAPARAAWDAVARWRMEQGLTISGATGAGKTRVATRGLRVAWDAGKTIGILPAAELRIRLWKSFDAAEKELEAATRPDVLLIDDLGQGAKSEQADEVILAILERRGKHGRKSIVTTQYTVELLIGRFFSNEIGEAICRRIGKQFAASFNLSPKP